MSKTVMLVDDEPDLIRATSFRLKHAGYQVLCLSEGKSALESLKNNKPDLVILDIHLPGMSGYEICQTIKSDDMLKHIPVIFFSATSSTEDIEHKVKELQAQGYIRKPFEPEELLAMVKKFLPS